VFGRIADAWGGESPEEAARSTLTVRVRSFSFRGGYPRDDEGHGGGFVFDCRAIPNPGKQAEYVALTGRDPAVAKFIEDLPEAEAFWRNAQALVDDQVREYRRRGFTSLSVSFGCTGGQHRSVYFAERLARHLAGTHPGLDVRLEHREASSWTP
jgi:RNase adaptor protein for sRNA GlmZ degradation